MLCVQDSANVVLLAEVVGNTILRNRQVFGVPRSAVVDSRGDNPEEEDNTDSGVGNTVPWSNERRTVERVNLSPIKSETSEGES